MPPRRRCYLIEFRHDVLPVIENSYRPHRPRMPRLFFSSAALGFLADGSSPFVEISRHLGIGRLAERIAAADRLQHLNVLIRHFPEDFLADHLFDLRFGDDAPVLVPVENHAQPIGRDLFPSKVVGLPHHIAQRRYLGDSDNIDLIAIADQFKMFIIQSRRQVHQNEVVAKPQKLEGLHQRAGHERPRRFRPLRRWNQVESAGVMEHEALQQFGVQPVGVFHQFVRVVAVLGQSQIKRGITEIVMEINHQHLSGIRLGQQSAQLSHDGGNAASALGPDKGQHLRLGLFLLLSAPATHSGHRIQQLLGIQRLYQIFAAAAAHGLNDQVRFGLRGHGEDSRLGRVGVNSFGDQSGAPAVEIEIQQANIGRRRSDPLEHRLMIVYPVLSQMPVEPDQRGGVSEQL